MSGVKCIAKEEHSRLNTDDGGHAKFDLTNFAERIVAVRGTEDDCKQVIQRLIHPHDPESQFAFFASIRG